MDTLVGQSCLLRKSLLRQDKISKNNAHFLEIKQLSLDIKNHFKEKKIAAVNQAVTGSGNGNISMYLNNEFLMNF